MNECLRTCSRRALLYLFFLYLFNTVPLPLDRVKFNTEHFENIGGPIRHGDVIWNHFSSLRRGVDGGGFPMKVIFARDRRVATSRGSRKYHT